MLPNLSEVKSARIVIYGADMVQDSVRMVILGVDMVLVILCILCWYGQML